MRILSAVFVAVIAARAAAQVREANLGQCPLELGGRIENCRVAYRTFGSLDAQKKNAILIPTWFASRADTWLPLLGPTGIVDTTGFFVVIVESLGAGSSSSPSNSESQHGLAFPEITVGDMVEASYRLAKDHLKLPELHAVVGISLGGLQAFEWGVQHPDYVRRIVPIHGGPRQAIYGRAMWELVTRVAEDGARGVVPLDSTATNLARFMVLAASSPASANLRADTSYSRYLATEARQLRNVDLYEWSLHGRAILRHDIARHFKGDLTKAANGWRAKTLVVISPQDHSVDSEPARAFARLIGADTLVITSDAGHGAIFGDSAAKARVRGFLKQ
jgi:homoserine O-acetyltransferase